MCAPPNAACESRTLRRDLSIFKTNMQTVAFLPWFPASTAGACGDSFAPTDHGSLITGHPSATPLESALTRPLTTVHSKGLIKMSFRCNTYEKRVGGVSDFPISIFEFPIGRRLRGFFLFHGSRVTGHGSPVTNSFRMRSSAISHPNPFRMRSYKNACP